jgi:predicted nuclease of predicted toxin-antitoxin system
MRFLIDAQLPPVLATWLATRGHEAQPVRDVSLRSAEDTAIAAFARRGDWVVVTKDEDFAGQVLGAGEGPRVVWLRIGNCTNPVLFAWLEPLWPAILRQLEAGIRVVEVQRASG